MEELYPSTDLWSTTPIPLEEHFKKFSEMIPKHVETVKQEDTCCNEEDYLSSVRDLMNIDLSDEEMKTLSAACSIDLLTCPGENPMYPVVMPDTLNYRARLSEAYIRSENTKRLETTKCASRLKKGYLYGNKRDFQQTIPITRVPDTPPDLRPGHEILLTILQFRPRRHNPRGRNFSVFVKPSHEILVLGSTTLDELRDILQCPLEEGLCKEVERLDEMHTEDPKRKYPSGFIFIRDVFYNDFRSPDALDYSEPILEWAKSKNLGEMKAQSMQGVALQTLKPRLGYPYLYMHQGDCEHLLVFSDVRLLAADDCLHSLCYPHVSKVIRSIIRRCYMCKIAYAKWMIVDSDRLPQNRVFMCKECCRSYCFKDGKKVGEFKLYPYYEKNILS